METPEAQAYREGSARRALRIEPPFDHYLLIERDKQNRTHLDALHSDFPALADRIRIEGEDANEVLIELSKRRWAGRRAVVFLDPFGMQVEWRTIEALAATRSVDLWVLFPLGVVTIRLLARKQSRIPEGWSDALDKLFGTRDWKDRFYAPATAQPLQQPTLFGPDGIAGEERGRTADLDAIGDYFVERLASIFAGVATGRGYLRNSKRLPLYRLCFAAANPKGAGIAVGIAEHLLKRLP